MKYVFMIQLLYAITVLAGNNNRVVHIQIPIHDEAARRRERQILKNNAPQYPKKKRLKHQMHLRAFKEQNFKRRIRGT